MIKTTLETVVGVDKLVVEPDDVRDVVYAGLKGATIGDLFKGITDQSIVWSKGMGPSSDYSLEMSPYVPIFSWKHADPGNRSFEDISIYLLIRV